MLRHYSQLHSPQVPPAVSINRRWSLCKLATSSLQQQGCVHATGSNQPSRRSYLLPQASRYTDNSRSSGNELRRRRRTGHSSKGYSDSSSSREAWHPCQPGSAGAQAGQPGRSEGRGSRGGSKLRGSHSAGARGVSGPVENAVQNIDQLKGWSQQRKQAVPGQYDQATDGTQAQQLYEQVLAMVQGSHVNMREGDGTLTCDDLCLLASRLPVLMQLLRRRGSVLPAASAIAQHAVDSLQQGDLPTTPRFWSELLYGLTKVGLVINAEMNASQIAKQHQQTNIHLHQLLDEGVMYLPSLLASKGAAAQDISMTLLAYAYAGYTGNLGPVVQAVADNLDRCLQRPAPQGIANTVWALGKLCDMGVPTHREPGVKASAYSWPVFSYALQQLTSFLHSGGMKPKPQEISNAVYGCALAGHTEGLPQFLALVCQHPGGVLDRAVPQDWSNMAWGTAVLFEAAANGGNMQLAGDLQRYGILLLARCLQRPDIVRGSKPQELSNTVWAAAKLRRVQEGSQLLNNLASNIHIMAEAKQQEWANSVWAAATLYEAAVDAGYQQLAQQLRRSGHVLMAECVKRLSVLKGAAPQAWSNIMCAAAKLGCEQEGAQLFCQLTNNLAVMKGAVSQAWSNILWAAAVLRLYNQDLFKRAMRELSAIPSAAIKPQEPSNALWACAICAHWDSGVQQLLSRVGESDLARFNRQDLANTAWAWAVLVCLAQEDGSYEQHEQCFQQVAVGLFRGAALHPVNSCTLEEGQQLYQARLLAGYLGIPGLPAGQVLQDALQAGLTADATSSRSQKGVNSVLREMGYSTQLEGLSRDSLMRADIVITALPGGRPCSIAVEYDGAPHYIAEHSVRTTAIDRLEGPIRLRNALLSRSFADGVFCIYWRDWAAVEGDREASVEYLSKALAKVVRDKDQHPGQGSTPTSNAPAAATARAPASTPPTRQQLQSAQDVRWVRKSPSGSR